MRFLAGGPNIPDQLLERRDSGRVVFVCGAGVSLPSNMPSFVGLTQYVCDVLDPPDDSPIANAFRPWLEKSSLPRTPLDQIFNLLHQEYGRDEVNALVADRLARVSPEQKSGKEHKLIARISSDQHGTPQIVTTNFDLLFEFPTQGSMPKLHVPPAFPNILHGVSVTGITYLHGRLERTDIAQHDYVLSSADFGRAYLSEGWATAFIRQLLAQYTVVLVGYQAEDPPVMYLLQGLNNDDRHDTSNLYAFDRGLHEDIEAKWRDRGVTPIAYSGEGDDHSALWDTLAAWAVRADDPRKWRSMKIELARSGPRGLQPHERGQVAHIARTTTGARLFARADPVLSAEWLCVFDAGRRSAKPSKGYGVNAEVYDPLKVYGLDDDPPRSFEPEREDRRDYDHLLEWRRSDTIPTDLHQLGGQPTLGFENLPSRLTHLVNWISKLIDSPLAAWWTFHQNGLHPRLDRQIRRNLRLRNDLDPKAVRTWNLLLEFHRDQKKAQHTESWMELKARIQNEGWSPSALREFERITTPKFVRSHSFGTNLAWPPVSSWAHTELESILSLDVEFNERALKLEIPDGVLESAFSIAQRNLLRYSGMFTEIYVRYFKSPTCYPNREIYGEIGKQAIDRAFQWFLSIFLRLADKNPQAARASADAWPVGDRFIFRKLSLFALAQESLFSGDEAAESILERDEESFWDFEIRRELLFLCHDRWDEFSSVNQTALVDRILSGPDETKFRAERGHSRVRPHLAAQYGKSLVIHGCRFTKAQSEKLDTIISTIPGWRDEWAAGIVTEYGTKSGWVEKDITAEAIADLPVNKIIEKTKEKTQKRTAQFIEWDGFTGLVKLQPRKALAALTSLARDGEYPVEFWAKLIGEWPQETASRLYLVFLHRLGKLPYDTVREMAYAVGLWVRGQLAVAYDFDAKLALNTFDHLLQGLCSDVDDTSSSLGEVRIGDRILGGSHRTYEDALNGPIGHLATGLLDTLAQQSLGKSDGLPEEFSLRMARLLDPLSKGTDHAISIFSSQMKWLHDIDPGWVMKNIVPLLNLDHCLAEPAWSGMLSNKQFPVPGMENYIKEQTLRLFPLIYSWKWDRNVYRAAVEWVLYLAIIQSSMKEGINNSEARNCLRNMDDENRNDAIWSLKNIAENEEDGWVKLIVPFIEQSWPREKRYRTNKTVYSWVEMLENTGDKFPDVLRAVQKFLVPIQVDGDFLWRYYSAFEDEEPLVEKFPEAMLNLLEAIVPNSPQEAPFELAQILEKIEEKDIALTQDRRFLRLLLLVEQR